MCIIKDDPGGTRVCLVHWVLCRVADVASMCLHQPPKGLGKG